MSFQISSVNLAQNRSINHKKMILFIDRSKKKEYTVFYDEYV